MKVPQVSDQAATLGELAVAENAAKLSPYAALEPHVTNEIPLGDVGSGATWTLPLAVGVSDLPANGATVTVQGEYMGVTFAAARAHVRFVGFRDPGGRALKNRSMILRATLKHRSGTVGATLKHGSRILGASLKHRLRILGATLKHRRWVLGATLKHRLGVLGTTQSRIEWRDSVYRDVGRRQARLDEYGPVIRFVVCT